MGEWKEVHEAVELQGCNVNIQEEDTGLSLVHWAIHQGEMEALTWLVEQRAFLRLKDKRGRTPLSGAGPEAAALLLQHAYSPVERLAYGRGNPRLAVLEQELEGLGPEAVNEPLWDEGGATLAVVLAGRHNQNGGWNALPLLQALAARGADLEAMDEEGNGILHMIDWTFGAVAALPLLSWALNEAEVKHFEVRNRDGDTPPLLCAYCCPSGSDALQCLRLFEAAGANFSLGSAKGMNVAMMLARHHGDGLWLNWCFSQAGVDPDQVCSRRRTAADYVSLHGTAESEDDDVEN